MRAEAPVKWLDLIQPKCRGARFFLATVVCIVLVADTVRGASFLLGTPVGLASLTNGQTLVVGDKLFSDFFISGDFTADQITVTPIEDSFGYGIRFSGGFVTLGGETKDMVLGYTVSVDTDAPYLISDVHLLFNGSVSGTGLAQVVEQVFTNNPVSYAGQISVVATATNNQREASFQVGPPQKRLVISKDVLLTARDTGAATISTIDQTFSQVPEPSTMVLVASGLVWLCSLRRRAR